MTVQNPKRHFTRFLEAHRGQLHFAAHAHHFWPDVSRDAHLQYWDDCATLSDTKWNKVFTEVIPQAQKHVAEILNLKNSEQIVFAPNTHELLSRLLSLYLDSGKVSILTTTSEFHSWKRQIQRLQEIDSVQVDMIDASQVLSSRESFIQDLVAGLKKNPDLFFISQVFFDSGIALTDTELLELWRQKSEKTTMVVDGYHGFAAIPADLSQLEGKIFFLGGGYKYAQAGEGVGFMVVPPGDYRPAFTGWFAEYGELHLPTGSQVGYPSNAFAFYGATQDPSGLYRFNAVWNLWKKEGGVKAIHEYVLGLQTQFLQSFPQAFLDRFDLRPVFDPSLHWHGHFLTFEALNEKRAQECLEVLKKNNVIIDLRGKRLRFGFGLYQSPVEVRSLLDCLQMVAIQG